MRQIYLDHNATAPIEQSALDALLFFCATAGSDSQNYGNASSIHWAGRKAKLAVDQAREKIAHSLNIENPEEICFTGSATEAINMALKGAFFYQKSLQKNFKLIISSVEHEATMETARFLESLGAELKILPVNQNGEISLSEMEEILNRLSADKNNFLLLSFMAANNETGVLFPFVEIGEMAKKYGALFHLDAVQAYGKIKNFSIPQTQAQLVSLSAHKIGGPKGVGALYLQKGIKLANLIHGGAQERKRRAGTTNVAGIVGFAAAAEVLSQRNLNSIRALRDQLEVLVREKISGTHVNGAGVARIGNTTNFLFDNVRGESLLMGLDLAGFAVSSGSACNSGSIGPSHVLMAMGQDKAAAASAVRVSIGPSTTEQEILAFVDALSAVVQRIREQAEKTKQSRA